MEDAGQWRFDHLELIGKRIPCPLIDFDAGLFAVGA
jgi:hypothetical protein